MSSDKVVIVAARRTPIGAFQGALSGATSPQLGAAAIRAAVADAGIDAGQVDRVLMGCVLPAGLGQAPARQAALGAGIPEGVPCVTVNKMCGSGMETIIIAQRNDFDFEALGADQTESGISTVFLGPVILGWHGKQWDSVFAAGYWFDTGDFGVLGTSPQTVA